MAYLVVKGSSEDPLPQKSFSSQLRQASRPPPAIPPTNPAVPFALPTPPANFMAHET